MNEDLVRSQLVRVTRPRLDQEVVEGETMKYNASVEMEEAIAPDIKQAGFDQN